MPPAVSVVMPAYNARDYISEAIGSVLAQTFDDHEIIVVDDGSVDDTGDLVQQFGHPVRYIRTENRGPSHARNVGIRAARGRYIAFLDADDLWTPDKLAAQVAFLEAKPEVGFVFADMLMFRQNEVVLPSYFDSIKDPVVQAGITGDENIIKDPTRLLLKCNAVPTGTVLVRRDCLEQTDLFDENISNVEDLDLWIRLSLCCRFGCIHRVLKRKRDHQDNISKDRRKALEAALYMCRKLARDFPQFNDRYRKDFGRRLSRHNGTLGYYFFSRNDMRQARAYLWRSLRRHPSARVVLLLCAAFLPLSITEIIRRIKSAGFKGFSLTLKE